MVGLSINLANFFRSVFDQRPGLWFAHTNIDENENENEMKWMHAKKRKTWILIWYSFKCFSMCVCVMLEWLFVCFFFFFFQRSSFVQFRFFFLLHLFSFIIFIIEPFHSIYIDSIDMQTKRDKNKTHRSWFTLNSHFFFFHHHQPYTYIEREIAITQNIDAKS